MAISFPKRSGSRTEFCVANEMRKVAVLFGALALCAGCSDGCANTVAFRVPAPDGRHDAVLFGRDCGATTGFSTQVSVLDPGTLPPGAGNAFIADDGSGAAPTGDWGGPWAELRWLGSDRLLVRHAAGARLFTQGGTVSGVRIVIEAAGDPR